MPAHRPNIAAIVDMMIAGKRFGQTTREGQTQEASPVEQENPYRIRRDLACLPRNRRFEFISLHRRVSGEPDFLSRARNPCLMAVRPTLSAA